jgi:hypothetical protein
MMAHKFFTLAILAVLAALILVACAELSREPFDPGKLVIDVFDPQPGEKILLMVDIPHDGLINNHAWFYRRQMAAEWREALIALEDDLGITVHPLYTYPATGNHNGPLPEEGEMAGQTVRLPDILADTNILLALTEYSATAPLIEYTQAFPNLRVASMPTVTADMQYTALAADYTEVANKSHLLAEKLDRRRWTIIRRRNRFAGHQSPQRRSFHRSLRR